MSFPSLLCLVLLATFGLMGLLLSGLLACACRRGLTNALTAPSDLLTLRLLPAAGALLIALTVVLPAFVSYEPSQQRETTGPLPWVLAMMSAVMLGHGLWRGGRAYLAARLLLRKCRSIGYWTAANGATVEILDVREPIVAVVGGWRPRIVAARCVVEACDREEFQQVIAHESAHVAARDNLKLLLQVSCPDLLAWLPCGARLASRWRAAAELEADQRATGSDAGSRLALASALIKVARLSAGRPSACPALSMQVAADDVEGRVRRLLGRPHPPCASMVNGLALLALLIPIVAVPAHALVHEVIEALVRFGH